MLIRTIAKREASSIFIGIIGLWPTVRKPVKLSQPPSFLLGLHLVASQFLLPNHWHAVFPVLCTAACGSCARRSSRRLQPGTDGCVPAAAFLVAECFLDHGLLALVRDPTTFDVPDFGTYKAWSCSEGQESARSLERTQSRDELVIVGDDNHSTGPISNGDRQTTKSFTVQEVTRFIQHAYLGVIPKASGDDQLDLLTTGQPRYFVILGDIAVKPNVLQVLTDDVK